MTRNAWVLAVMLCGCASLDRSCTSCMATEFGSDWIVVQLSAMDGKPLRCWKLKGASVVSEEGSDGIKRKDTQNGNMIHIAGFYNYVQVKQGEWTGAFRQLGLTEEFCDGLAARTWGMKAEAPKAPAVDP